MTENRDATRTIDDVKLGEEYDKARAERAAADDSKELGEDRKLENGVVVTGSPVLGTTSLFPGAEDVTAGGVVAREAKGLATDDVVDTDTTWTAQSGKPYVEDNAANVPGQTFTIDELPDARVMASSGLPPHTLPANLLVDGAITDSLNTSQESGSDLGTSPKKDESGDKVPARAAKVKADA